MPIPKPGASETQSEFISRCISFVTDEGKYPQNQVAAICYSQWDNKEEDMGSQNDDDKRVDVDEMLDLLDDSPLIMGRQHLGVSGTETVASGNLKDLEDEIRNFEIP